LAVFWAFGKGSVLCRYIDYKMLYLFIQFPLLTIFPFCAAKDGGATSPSEMFGLAFRITDFIRSFFQQVSNRFKTAFFHETLSIQAYHSF
ncbi:MAG: hypothetical protein LBF74_07955, partial [Treponema sp.]|nr:hypothetical protein [Treponema sp.]